jgi:integrase
VVLSKVKAFLDSIGRNSRSSKATYSCVMNHFQDFLTDQYQYDCETILQAILENKVNVYELLDHFVSFLVNTKPDLTPQSIRLYVVVMKSYLAYHDIDIIPAKFKRRVKTPKFYRQDEEPLDASDIRRILLACNNRRLKPYILMLASGGMRPTEALAIRYCDINFSVSPTRIHIRKEYAKTRVARDIYISDEATSYLKQWISWKYRDKNGNKKRQITKKDSDLVFRVYNINGKSHPNMLYKKVILEFQKTLAAVGMDERKEEGVHKRRKITLHSFRRFVKTVVSDQTNQDYSEWFLGHNKSPYYTKKEPERREIYATKCTKYLTFLDYTTLEARGKSIEANLREKDREMKDLEAQIKLLITNQTEMSRRLYEAGILKKD